MESFDFASAPGHLIRRAHQVSVALFMEGAAGHDITQVQFALLNALIDTPGLDQVTLAQRVAMDAATSGSVIERLEAKGWLRRQRDEDDRRRRRVWITEAGMQAVRTLKQPIGESQAKLTSALTAEEAETLTALLKKLVSAHTQ